jgi:hypothetical protein
MNIQLQNLPDATLRGQLSRAVEDYAEANPSAASVDDVQFEVLGPDGKPLTVRGAFQRGPLGEVVFTVVQIIGLVRKVVDALKGRRPSSAKARRAQKLGRRVSKRDEALFAIANHALPADPEARWAYLVEHDVVQDLGGGRWKMGKVTGTRDEVAEHINKAMAVSGAVVDGVASGAPESAAEVVSVAPKKPAAKKSAKKAAKAAVKKAAPKKAKKAPKGKK